MNITAFLISFFLIFIITGGFRTMLELFFNAKKPETCKLKIPEDHKNHPNIIYDDPKDKKNSTYEIDGYVYYKGMLLQWPVILLGVPSPYKPLKEHEIE